MVRGRCEPEHGAEREIFLRGQAGRRTVHSLGNEIEIVEALDGDQAARGEIEDDGSDGLAIGIAYEQKTNLRGRKICRRSVLYYDGSGVAPAAEQGVYDEIVENEERVDNVKLAWIGVEAFADARRIRRNSLKSCSQERVRGSGGLRGLPLRTKSCKCEKEKREARAG